jgi:hypothetical protein
LSQHRLAVAVRLGRAHNPHVWPLFGEWVRRNPHVWPLIGDGVSQPRIHARRTGQFAITTPWDGAEFATDCLH